MFNDFLMIFNAIQGLPWEPIPGTWVIEIKTRTVYGSQDKDI